MTDMDIEAEIRELKHRVSQLEGSFGFLTQQVKGVHTALLEFQKETIARFDKVDAQFDKVEARLDRVEHGIQSLRDDLPDIIANAVGEALRR